jgi:CBS domain-containing protein
VHTARAQLNPDQSLREALEEVRQHPDISYFPVVDPDRGSSLLGILSQNDLLAAFRKQSR